MIVIGMTDIWKDMPLIEQGTDLIARAETARVGREFTAAEVPTVIAAYKALLVLCAALAERALDDEAPPDHGGDMAG